MSHSRNRRPSRTSEPARKAPAAYVTNNAKGNGGTKDKIKIPRNVRYDLENALLGLCDVWFEEIKPHLIKNNVKLHTGGALNENSNELEPTMERRWDGRRQLDPGAASDTHRRAVNSEAYSKTQPAASKAPCLNLKTPSRNRPISPTSFCKLLQLPDNERMRPPTPVRRVPAPEQSPPFTENYQQYIHNSSKQRKQPPVQKTPLQRSPPTQPNPRGTQALQRNVPNSTKLRKQPPVQKTPLQRSPPTQPNPRGTEALQRDVPNSTKLNASSDRKKRISARTRRRQQIPSSRFPYPKRVLRPRCIACVLAKEQTKTIPEQSLAVRTQLPRNKNTPIKPSVKRDVNFSHPKCQQTSVPTQDRGVFIDLPFCARSFSPAGDVLPSLQHPGGNTTHDHPSTATTKRRCRRKFPVSLHHAAASPSPLHAKCLAQPEHHIALTRENQPVSTILSPAPSTDEMWFHRVFEKYTKPQSQPYPPTRQHTVCDRMFSKHQIPINDENKLLFEDKKPLFSKDLIDLIGKTNDDRLRVLYENPTRQELKQSVMCLVGARKKSIKTKKMPKMPWR